MPDAPTEFDFDADALIDGALAPEAAAEAAVIVGRNPAVAAAFGRRSAEAAVVAAILRDRASASASSVRPLPRQQQNARMFRFDRRLAAAAAIVGVALLGALAGFAGSNWRVEGVRQELLAAAAEDRRALRDVVQEALERRKSGEAVAWRDDAGGDVRAQVTPVRTYRSVDGHWCREFVIEGADLLPTAAMRAVACRDAGGHWRGAAPQSDRNGV